MKYRIDLWLGKRFRRSILRYGDLVVLATALLLVVSIWTYVKG